MKRFLSLLVIGLIVVVPFKVRAVTELSPKCDKDTEGNISCTLAAKFDEAVDNVVVTLTEKGGADIVSIYEITDSNWTIASKPEVDGVHTVTLNYGNPSESGEHTLFGFKYTPSGEDDCTIVITLNDATYNTPTPDVPTTNKQTGISVPYIALGAITLLAVGAYMTTKNKAKMFNI